tara:strand:- start:4252 stop:4467 length:216 start_codon:yes stop_codon:yes gene_type:complete
MVIPVNERVKQYRARKKQRDENLKESLKLYSEMMVAIKEIVCEPPPQNPDLEKVCALIFRTEHKLKQLLNK